MRKKQEINIGNLMRFLFPSLLGIFIFLVPVNGPDGVTLIVNLIIDKTKILMGEALVPFVLLVLTISALCSTIGFLNPNCFKGYFKGLFNVGIKDLTLRIIAAIFSYMIYFKTGPYIVWSDDTGQMMMNDVVSNLIPFFLWAGMFLPLLTEFGLMEFIGNILRPIMRPVFKLPGRAAVNCAVSWVGSGTMGIVLTKQEYEKGFYTRREAVFISTGFSIASIAIVSLLCGFINMTEYFPLIYCSCIFIGLAVNFILIRIPPISKMSNLYVNGSTESKVVNEGLNGKGILKTAVENAVYRASQPKENIILNGLKVTGDIWFTLEPAVLVIGTIATILVEFTPIVHYLSIPIAALLSLLQVPEATIAGQSILLGFVDVFLPFITGSVLTNTVTRFVLAVVCVLQIIYITETGPMLLKVKIGLRFLDIFIIFVMRTVLAILFAVPMAMLILD